MGVEIHYKDVGGVLTATDIHSGLAPSEGTTGAAAPGGSLRGTVTAVSGTSVTVKDGAKDWVFAVDAKTRVVGQGLGTLNEKLKAEGKAPTVLDLVGVNDRVYVYLPGRRQSEGQRDPRDPQGREVGRAGETGRRRWG